MQFEKFSSVLDIALQEEDPFFLVNQERIIRQIELWKKCFPKITPHYAVKCNNKVMQYKELQGIVALIDGITCAGLAELTEQSARRGRQRK